MNRRFKDRYGIKSDEMIDAPNILKLALEFNRNNGDDNWKDEAAKMYVLAGAFDTVPAGVLLGVIRGTTEVEITEDRNIIFHPYGKEE